jgi:hypothetical protein
MRIFFESRSEIETFLNELYLLGCPSCGATGTLVRHGYIRGYISPKERGIRAWRILCKKARGGCGRAPSVRLAESLRRRCFTAAKLWSFILALLQTHSVKAAWERGGIRLSLDTGYRLYKRLHLGQSILRTYLHSRAPPPEEKCAGSTLLQVFKHLQDIFGDSCAVSAYQQARQKDFLAIA